MAHETGNWMWAEALQLLDRAERIQRGMFRPAAGSRVPCWEPPVDIVETEHELWIQAALPGVSADRIEVVLDGDTIVVRGDRPLPFPGEKGVIHRLEVPHGRFERRIRLPAGHYALGRRDLAGGCLTLTLRKLG